MPLTTTEMIQKRKRRGNLVVEKWVKVWPIPVNCVSLVVCYLGVHQLWNSVCTWMYTYTVVSLDFLPVPCCSSSVYVCIYGPDKEEIEDSEFCRLAIKVLGKLMVVAVVAVLGSCMSHSSTLYMTWWCTTKKGFVQKWKVLLSHHTLHQNIYSHSCSKPHFIHSLDSNISPSLGHIWAKRT